MLKPGDLVGPYEIRGFVGQGGMGQVYRAFDPRLERTVALKVIVVPQAGAPGSQDDVERVASESSARLLREARAVASLSHPNVVHIYDVGESQGRLYLAMEYVVGATLRTLITTEVPLARKVRWLVDIARALEAAHRGGVVHRDVKPENVMVREDGGVKVLDFGIARRAVTGGQVSDTITGSGAIAGTPVYMAPEQIRGNDVDARCDQFAFGVVAYELLTGTRPWADGPDVLAVVARVLTEVPVGLREHDAKIPASVEETVIRALAKEPSLRFPTMSDVADALEPFATQTTGGDRVRITPSQRDRDHVASTAAYAATTRVPTTIEVAGAEPRASSGHPAAPTTDERDGDGRRRSSALRLAVPLLLIAALGVVVTIVRRNVPITSQSDAGRALSLVPEAETSYEEAMRLWRDGATQRAESALRKAVGLDPTFATAHLELALQLLPDDPSGAQQAFQEAFQHRQMLTARGAVLLEASEPFVRPKPDLDEWETRLTAAVFQFPRDAELQYWLGRARERQGADEAAKSAYGAAVTIDEGYVPALASLANVERNLGHDKEALATTARCIEKSPVASTCFETRARLLGEMGECARAKEEATQWRRVDPASATALGALARLLHATGSKRPAVEEVLSQRWALLPTTTRKQGETWDRMLLAIADGDFVRAEGLAKEYESTLAASSDQFDHAEPTKVRVNLLMEMDRPKDAAKIAKDYLERMDAWPPWPFAPDASFLFLEPLIRTSQLSHAELISARERWLDRERTRVKGADRDSARNAWTAWAYAWGSFPETTEEANEAITHMPPKATLPSGSRRPVMLDFAIGKAYVLAGRLEDAIPHLTRVTGTCAALDNATIVVRAHALLAAVYDAKNEPTTARAEWEKVTTAWPKDTPSKTLHLATERLAKLGVAPP